MALKDALNEAFNEAENEENPVDDDKLTKEDLLDPEKIIQRAVSETSKRIKNDTLGRVAVVLATLLIALNNVAVGWLQGQGMMSVDTIIILLIGMGLYILIKILNHVNNWVTIWMNKKDLEVDIKQLELKKVETKTTLQEMRDKNTIMHESLQNQRNVARADLKFKQDLELRVPLYEEAQLNMMKFFARDDIVEILKVPPTFADAVRKMDDMLFQRTDIDLTLSDITEKFGTLLQRYESVQFQVKETAMLLDSVVQNQSVHTVKYRDLELGQKKLQQEIEAVSGSMMTLTQIIDARLPSKDGLTVSITANTEKAETEISDMSDQIDQLAKELAEKTDEEIDGILDPPPD